MVSSSRSGEKVLYPPPTLPAILQTMHGRALLTLAVLAACAIALLPLAGATTRHHHHHHHGKAHHHHHRRAGSRIGERPCKCCDIDPENYNACPCRNEGACPPYRRLLAEEPAQQHGGQVPLQEAEELVGVWKMEVRLQLRIRFRTWAVLACWQACHM